MIPPFLKLVLPLIVFLGASAPNVFAAGPAKAASAAVRPALGNRPLGSGDGRIHVIPALSAPSVKNGGKLTVQAVVKAQCGIARVEAEIEGVTRLELKPAASNRGAGLLPVSPAASASAALYQADWTARGLKEKVYPVTLRVTDLAGHVYEDHSLSVSDPAAGNSTVGSTAYPFSTVTRRVGVLKFVEGDLNIHCMVLDPAGGYAYLGLDDSTDDFENQSQVIKVRLSDFKRVGTLTLNAGENWLSSAAIDPAGGYAYFSAQKSPNFDSSPAHIIRIRLSDFTLAGTLVLNAGENDISCAVIDPAAGFAYFAIYREYFFAPASVVKVRLSNFTRVGALTFNAGEEYFTSAVIDPTKGYAYFGTGSSYSDPASVVKVRLADFTRLGALKMIAGEEGGLSKAVIDPSNGYAYFVAEGIGNMVLIKVRLSDFTRVGALALTAEQGRIYSLAIDPAGGYLYYGTYNGNVVKVRLSGFTSAGSVQLLSEKAAVNLALIDSLGGYAYFGTKYSPGCVVKVRLSDFTNMATLTLNRGENWIHSAAIDPTGGYAYFGIESLPGVVKVRLADFTRVGVLRFNPDEADVDCAVIDPERGYAYFGTLRKIIKIRLSDFKRVGELVLGDGENEPSRAVIDTTAGYAYFSLFNYATGSNSHDPVPGSVIKIRLSDFTRVGTLKLEAGELIAQCAVIDPAAGFAYFGTNNINQPGGIVKVRLSDFTRVATLKLNQNEYGLFTAAIDPAGDYAYLGTDPSYGPITMIKVRLSDFTRMGSLKLGYVHNAMIDPTGGYLYCATQYGNTAPLVNPCYLRKVRLSDFTLVEGGISMSAGERFLSCAVIDPATGFIYWGCDDRPGKVVKMALSCKNSLRANRVTLGERGTIKDVRFYSHAAKGNLRLAIYDDATTKTLRWQSGSIPNMKAGDWVTVPISAGTPAWLTLHPGKYWLAWQSDSSADVPSYAQGIWGEGFSVDQPYGPFPARLGSTVTSTNGEKWSEYLTYVQQNAVMQWRMYP